jgi:hypothetical protein
MRRKKMKSSKQLFTVIFLLLFLTASMGHGDTRQTGNDRKPSTPGERSVLRNQYGAPIRDARGEWINYTRDQIRFQSSQVQNPDRRHSREQRSTVKQITGSPALWSYSVFGIGIGDRGMVVDTVGGRKEIYLDAYNYWYTLYYNHSTNIYEQGFVSTGLSSEYYDRIIALRLGDVTGDPGKEIVVAMENGSIHIYDQVTKNYLTEVTTAVQYWATDLEIADVDNDGQNELILGSEDRLYVYSASGTLEWDMDIPVQDIVVGQMDNDSGLEIAVAAYFSDDNGYVIDCSSRTIQWTWPHGFGVELAAADIDNDNRDELIAAEGWYVIFAYDVERQLPKWSIPTDLDNDAIYLADIDNDSVVELLLGEGQWGSVIAYDTVTLNQEWSIENPEHGVTGIAVADIDGDGQSELMWGAGYSSSGEDIFYIANWQAGQIEWESSHLDGPFIGPGCGDLDGDGNEELVVVSYESRSGYSSGRILVFNTDGNLRAISDPIVDDDSVEGTKDIKLYDVDRDGKLEILVAADHWYDGVIEIYDFNANNTFTLNWTNATPTDDGFNCVSAGDIDGDGNLEIVGGSWRYIYAYDYNTGSQEWQSLYHSGEAGTISAVEVSDVDNDGDQEIISMVYNGDVYIFNGRTKVLDTVIFGPYTAMTLIDSTQEPPSLALGSEDGNIKILTYSGGDYQTVFNKNYSSEPIDGISRLSTSEELIFGTNGTLNIADNSGIIWTSAAYGPVYGKRAVIPGESSYIFSAGSYSVNAFEYLPAPATITVTRPNGGEYWYQGSSQEIAWMTTGTVGNVTIEYSSDNGDNWSAIATGTPNDGSRLWTVPDTVSNLCLIRVSESDGSPADTSDQAFSIEPAPIITVTSPNGGEEWPVGKPQTITWTCEGNVENVIIQCSFNGGTTWKTIAVSTENDGQFDWITPNRPSDNCLIRVIAGDVDEGPADVSDEVFAIVSPITAAITVNSPNGGESWIAGSSREITWKSNGDISNVTIKYSTDNGTTWKTIAQTTANDGSFDWNVPDTASNECLVQVIGNDNDLDPKPADISDNVFSIDLPPSPTIEVTSPNGGEQLPVGSRFSITWYATNSRGEAKIEYSINGGDTWTEINGAAENNGKYDWTVPDTPSQTCLVRISEIEGQPTDVSDAVFAIVSPTPGDITVTSPNGGETWEVGSSYEIKWDSTGIDHVTIEYSQDYGITWKTIVQTTPNSGSFDWTTPDTASEECLVRITSNDGGTDPRPSDVSDSVFSIVSPPPPTIKVTAPNGGEQLQVGSRFDITWLSSGTREDVKIEYSFNSGDTWTVIADAAENNGKYDWLVPDTPLETCLVRISETDGQPMDISDAVFSIVQPVPGEITVTSPNGGENWTAGSLQEIKWTGSGDITNVNIKYSTDNGVTWNAITQATANDGSFDWTIPDTASDECLVRITSNDGGTDPRPSDVSDDVFSIVSPLPSFRVTSPNGGESWEVGSDHAITWNSTGNISDVMIEYSFDNGNTWSTIVSSANNSGNYNWLVPDTVSEECLVRITANDGGGDPKPADISDEVFSIIPPSSPTIKVLTPNGGEELPVGSRYSITWYATDSREQVKIEYTVNGGETWTEIIGATENDGDYDWIIPDEPSDICLVRISEIDGEPVDISNAVFSIVSPSGDITVNSPNGGENLEAGTEYVITWDSTGVDNVIIKYSTDNAVTWTTIGTAPAAQGFYTWPVPGTPSETCRVQVTAIDAGLDPRPADMSDEVFSIFLPVIGTIRVDSPNGGETLTTGAEYDITWTSTGVTNVIIEYSIDNGAEWIYIDTVSAGEGRYTWTVPQTPSQTCLVRISGITPGEDPFDISDDVFSIIAM